MRRPRIKAEGEGFYHVVSRIGGKRFLIDAEEKGILLATIRAAAAFSGVELYTFAVMSNHFHLLVRVPRKREVPDAELLRRMEALYGTPRFHKVLEKWEKWNKTNQESRVENEKARLRARMHDLSQFCKTFKETYTQDFNRRHGNTGTIWEGRFKSILLDGSRRAMMTVAGYIHLNPVRAGMAETAEDAENAGYGAACRGDTRAQAGLLGLVKRVYGAKDATWVQAREACAEVVAGTVPGGSAGGPPAVPGNGAFKALLRSRVAGFLHGGALGDERFLKRVAARLPKRARRHSETRLDRCPFLGFRSAAGVREVS